ncbi:hypothetical protein SAMN05661091_4911 [Paenibacillus uliginis N3/975]|uniref:DUF4375 domain-containing protein n=1 Tax=Paenibacillus uliginis N3/975 TaxID=1313296 RepID=A0A1X7HNV0_9BACL|nr:hypothetical protein [Paenibacillus uliginis]SMF90153.1 hypothetical protein SAMN05661091_4911 [Paenibacillus uliginis N3/975]
MSIGLNEIWDGKIPADEMDLAELSDKIWEIGELDAIQEKVSPELFQLHIAINMIGNWQSDGWDGIIAYQPYLVPYISEVLVKFGLQHLQHAFDEVIAIFPDFITFEDGSLYCDMINFLHNMRLKVSDERLNAYTQEERQAMVKQYQEKLNQLEKMTEPLWGYGSPMDGWAMIFDYIQAYEVRG